jgi:hypothetical protein
MARRPQMTRELAESVAIQALGFIAEEPDRLGRFLALSGLSAESLRAAAQEPNFLLGVLDYLASDETLLRDFAGQREIAPEDAAIARDVLAGAPPTVS